MTTIDVYIAHRDSIKFIEQQILLIRKYFFLTNKIVF